MLYNVDCSVLDFISSDISEEHDTPIGSKMPQYLSGRGLDLFI